MRQKLIPVLIALSSIGACSSQTNTDVGKDQVAKDCKITIDRFKEIMIVDDAVISDARAKNAENGPWSFRYAISSIMPSDADASTFLLSWFDNWARTTEFNGYPTDVESRASGIQTNLVCPWLRRTPENECDVQCVTCARRKLDLAKAPFRLIAIVNRLDLQGRPDPDATSAAGEGRLIFALTEGAADDPTSPPRAGTLIFEYGLPPSLSPKDWVATWHHLGTHASFDEGYRSELQSLTDRFVKPGSDPQRANGTALARIRTNESAFNWIWQLRQFTLDSAGALRLSAVTNTPAAALSGTTRLRDYVTANRDAILNDRHLVPMSMLAGASDQFVFRWLVPGVDETTRAAFSRGTCNGCHSEENPPIDTAFHVSPFRNGIDKLSPFVNNPADPAHDDLGRREARMTTTLCETSSH